MTKSLLTEKQQRFLAFVNQEQQLYQNFYFTGGTALTEYYLQHRFSEDLDFFCFDEIAVEGIFEFISNKKNLFGAKRLDYQNHYNRHLFFFTYPDREKLKVEFTFYPFTRIDQTKKVGHLQIDSYLDIATNKIFTIFQNPRGRDYYDLYYLCHKYDLQLLDLVKKARQKFDFPIDYLKLAANLIQVKDILDDPILINALDKNILDDFFFQEAKKLKTKIFN